MGLEYKIKFRISDQQSIENFLARLSPTFKNEVTISLEENGFYFCDNCADPSIAAKTFYRLVQEACSQGDEVTISQL